MDSSNLETACAIQVGARTVELHVLHDAHAWRWEMRFAGGQTLDAGAAATRFSAKIAVQSAFELRLRKAGIYKLHRVGYGYNWE